MHLVLVFLNRPDQPEKAVERLREFGVPDPLFVRARSTAAALSAEVPIFAGLRSLAIGADEDRLVLVTLKSFASDEEAERLVSRLQLEMDADSPPSGRIVALPVVSRG
ncbi:MAG: hypothetical protein ACYC8T_35720 [Myxococcaceae bacterium]